MKILHIGKYYPPHHGGMETAVRDMCETAAGEVDVEVIAANTSRQRSEEAVGGVRVTRLSNWKTLMSQPIIPSLVAELRRRKPDVVHLHAPNPWAMACWLMSGSRARLIVHYHSDIVRQRRLARILHPLLDRVLSRAETIVVGSEQLRDHSPVLARWREKCAVIPFGILLSRFLELDRSQSDQTRRPQVLALGRLSYYKGFQHLVEAARSVDARFVIAGEGEMRPALERAIAQYGLESKVHLAGRVSDAQLLSLYRESDIFCFPSCEPSEAFGLAMVEALAAGLPVVSTDLPTGVRYVNQNGVTGWVVAPGDAAALASKLNDLVQNPGRRLQFGLAGRDRAQRLFAREKMGRALVELYRRPNSVGHRSVGEAAHA